MKLSKIEIKNHKSLKEVSIVLKEDVNVFIGKNNTGKSNIVDALLFFSNIENERLSLNLAEYKEIVFGKDIEKEILFDLEYTISDEEISSLFSKLQLQDISFDDFKKSVQKNIIRHVVKLHSRPFTLLQEEIYCYFNENEILYGKGLWKNGSYERQIIENFKEGVTNENWNLTSYGAGSPPEPLLHAPTTHTPIKPEENLLLLLHDFVVSFKNLSPVRSSPETLKVYGGFKLKPDASNLPQVLNSIASSNRRLFDAIMNSASEIIEEISEIRAPLRERTDETYLSVVESPFEEEEFTWKHIASGTKEILYLITLLYTTPKKSLLMIEEPEIHLHAEAISKFLDLLKKISEKEEKQIILTTHSPIFVDLVSFDNLFVVTKEAGKTEIVHLKGYKKIDEILLKGGIPKSWVILSKMPSFILVIEGRDDVKIWNQFLLKKGINAEEKRIRIISSGEENSGGYEKVIMTGKFLKKIRSPIPFMMIVDSNNKKEEKIKEFKREGFSESEFHVLNEKEIESYLIDTKAISKTTGKAKVDVEKAIDNAGGNGKEKLKNIFKNLGLSEPVAETKELLVIHMDEIPEEISQMLDKIKEKIEE